MKYRKIPVVVEAFLVPTPGHAPDEPVPPWLVAALLNSSVTVIATGGLNISTLEGLMRADIGDYVIKGIKGELYPCKPDIFIATYELVREEAQAS
jgi:hypothetical protein